MEFKPGGWVNDCAPVDMHDLGKPHPWKAEFIVPLKPTPEQIEYIARVMAFQNEIELLDTSWLDEG